MAPQTMPDRRPASLFLNTLAASAAKLSGYAFSFLSAPIVLSGLGLRQFGIWALTGGLVQYGALLDLGVGYSLIRFVAAHGEDRQKCGGFIAVAVGASLGLTAVLALAAITGAAPLAHAVGGIAPAQMRVLLLASVTLFGSAQLSQAVSVYALGRRRMVVPNIALTVASVVNFVASIGAIALGAHLEGYALANAAAGVLALLLTLGLILRYEGAPPLARPRRGQVRELLSFSIRAQAVVAATLVNYQTDKIVIAFTAGPAAAGAYELANRAAVAVREIGVWATSAVGVELTAELVKAGIEAIRTRYVRLTVVAAAVGLPSMFLAIATAPLLLSVWLHHAPRLSTAVLVALSAAYLPAAMTGVTYAMVIAIGRPGIVARTSVAAAVLNVVLTVALAPVFGVYGVLAGTIVALVAGQLGQVIAVHRTFHLGAASYLQAVVPAMLAYGLFAVPVAALCYGVDIRGRAAGAAVLSAAALVYLAACGIWATRQRRLPQAVLNRLPRLAPTLSP